MRLFTRSLNQAAGLAALLALFPAFVLFFRVVVIGLPLDLPAAATHDFDALLELIRRTVVSDTGMPLGGAVSLLYPHRRGLETQDGRAGLFIVCLVSMLAGFVVTAVTGRGSAEMPASCSSAIVLAGLGSLVLKNAALEGADTKTPRVLSGARASSYQQAKRREYRGPES